MKLTGPDSSFELHILDYEYSDSPYFMDRNWLLINLRTRYQNKEYTTTAPLLSTWEIELLIQWMRSMATQEKLSNRLSFVEPCLGFSTQTAGTDDYAFNIQLAHEATPHWYSNDTMPFRLPVRLNANELETAIADLEGQLGRFPVRD